MKYFSMFSGIGGFEYGIQQVSNDFECVGFSEVDKYAISIYKKHFPNHTNRGDATKIETNTLPEFQMLVGGFPCQTFSVAGKKKGFNDTRGTLFFEIARILKDKRPRYFLLENVAGLLYHENGETFQTILRVLSEMGYFLEWQILNSKNFGVPQNRNRIFIVGHLREKSKRKIFPLRNSQEKSNGEIAYCLDANYHKCCNDPNKRNRTIISVPLKYLDRNQRNYTNQYSLTVDTCNTNGILEGDKLRYLTPIECERLQGFPDNYTKYGQNGELISDTQRYKCLGNAVTTNVISAIMEELK